MTTVDGKSDTYGRSFGMCWKNFQHMLRACHPGQRLLGRALRAAPSYLFSSQGKSGVMPANAIRKSMLPHETRSYFEARKSTVLSRSATQSDP
ncbi:hypothetical protein [Azomonas macrocytogenes]|uniref:Uncharacterized protein n=1 Tax=Azomonas macrocytogenes TaxID=69962 RepID=A0A839TBD3_AZOMA|nr:hypothetical protein [Azomonas macrocytogenes]MBB3105365.1 hypothetical protein [Azomonas macrocytogenes]